MSTRGGHFPIEVLGERLNAPLTCNSTCQNGFVFKHSIQTTKELEAFTIDFTIVFLE